MRLKIRIVLTLLTVFCLEVIGQDENRFKNFHGIKDPESGVFFFEAEGYDIFIEWLDIGLNEKGISKIKKKYSANDAQLTIDSVTNLKVLARVEPKNGVTTFFPTISFPYQKNCQQLLDL